MSPNLKPFKSGTDFADYDETLAEDISKFTQNNKCLQRQKQPFYVTEVVEGVLDQLDEENIPADITRIDELRTQAQRDLTDRISREDSFTGHLSTVQQHCHDGLFEGHEEPPHHHGEKQWHMLFDILIQRVHLYRLLDTTPEKAESLSDDISGVPNELLPY